MCDHSKTVNPCMHSPPVLLKLFLAPGQTEGATRGTGHPVYNRRGGHVQTPRPLVLNSSVFLQGLTSLPLESDRPARWSGARALSLEATLKIPGQSGMLLGRCREGMT